MTSNQSAIIRSEVVEQQYRLQVEDLPEGRLSATIAGVSYQGLEHMQPVLHFQENRKALVLSRLLCLQLVELTGSVIADDWIGHTIRLQAIVSGGDAFITIDMGNRAHSMRWIWRLGLLAHPPISLRVILFVLLLGLLSLTYTMQNWEAISGIVSNLFP